MEDSQSIILTAEAESLLRDETQRARLLSMHPLQMGTYIIPTPMIMTCYEEASSRVADQRTGTLFAGESRLGKTYTARWCKSQLIEDFPQCAVTAMFVPAVESTSNERVHRLLLDAIGHPYPQSARQPRLLKMIISAVISRCAQLGGHQFVLVIDEANNLGKLDFHQLIAIQNGLDEQQIKMTSVLFGLTKLKARISQFREDEEDQIIARFFRSVDPFYGCRSVEELHYILSQYDSPQGSAWPDGTNICFTRFYFPLAYVHNGFRLSNYASSIWETLESRQKIPIIGLQMEIVALVVRHLFLDNFKRDSPCFAFTPQDIDAAIEKSDYGNQNPKLNL
ncbi:ATP-binding protein [Cupriavidus sp. P-10]|uniref:ATP-binding protein n=1 Tax=Cupriavidus sp. P-10 TaxID=2027911 RepID=UPI000E2E9673|nr:ATP-binding protein [Cupriavidus sp. P-10]BDB27231.1 ATP-binding protein [Cupriavidus sp. P-10]